MATLKFWESVNDTIERADVILLVLDARLIEETRNEELEDKVMKVGKPLIYVITKSDLVDKRTIQKERRRLHPCVLFSAKERHGTRILRERIFIEFDRAGLKWPVVRVGVLGYPNVGKSSLINAMRGKGAAPVSALSGITKGVMNVRTSKRMEFIDTPGVIPYLEKDSLKHTLIGTVDFSKARDPHKAAMKLMEMNPGEIEARYGVKTGEDKYETLEEIALKRNFLLKGKKPDVTRISRLILKEWQVGRAKKK